MRKFKGFTLAEVLITLAIIGVVASVTMPALLSNVTAQQVPPALAKAINTLENGNSLILQQRSSRTLNLVCPDGYLACFQEFAHANTVTPPDTLSLGGASTTFGEEALQTKDGIIYISNGNTIAGTRELKKFFGEAYTIKVDINGHKGPNMDGRDQFLLYVDYYGTVIAHGGRTYNEFLGNAGDAPLWEESCPNRHGNNSAEPTDYTTCAGSIVDNGFKISYRYK